MFRCPLQIVAMTLALNACAQAGEGGVTLSQAGTEARNNPLLTVSPLPYQAPPFDKIRDEDYQPGIEAGMRQQLAEIEKIAGQPAMPSFDNTIVSMELSGALLTRVTNVFRIVQQTTGNATLEKIEQEIAPKLAEHRDEILLNPTLFARIGAVYDHREDLDAEAKFLTERYYRTFVRAGAQLPDSEKRLLQQLNKEEARLQTQFRSKLLTATNAGALVIHDKSDLTGLSQGEIAAAAVAAKERNLGDAYLLPLEPVTQQAALRSLTRRAVRERLFKASTQRAQQGDENDTRTTVQRLAQVRARKAKLLGYANYAAYKIEDEMAQTPERALQLLTVLIPAALTRAKEQAVAMQTLIDDQNGATELAAWDWPFYAERLRKAQYQFDESDIRPYFELNRVLYDGLFLAANKLYGVTFKERTDIPVYQADVRVFEVFDADGTPLALWYADYYRRDSKGGGAYTDSFLEQSDLRATRAVVVNVCNFTKPPPGQPALLSSRNVITMFHEFGHALHAVFSKVRYPSLSKDNVSLDFREFPSQLNERWAREPMIFASYARHFQTGAPMPPQLVAKLERARVFNQGFLTGEYVGAALIDLAWHTVPADAPLQDVDHFEAETLRRFHVDYLPMLPRFRSTYFEHIWGYEYAAGYYSYSWAQVLADDSFKWFKEHGGMTRKNGQRLREMILARGRSEEFNAMFRAFRGRDPSVEPMLEQLGLK